MAIKAVLSESIGALKASLSSSASIIVRGDEAFEANALRWSQYKAPQPGAVVNVANESDIIKTVSWANTNGAKFLAQNGGHGWVSTMKIGERDIVINLRAMRDVTVDLDAGTVTIGAGALVGEVVDVLHKNKVHAAIGTCNSVGAIGACIGGGMGRLQGLLGLGVDNMISAQLITAEGKCITVSSAENSDLWWGMRGAGHNFGIISSLTIKTYPEINSGQHWMSTLFFTPDKIETVAEATNGLDWDQGMAFHIFMTLAPPEMKPTFLVSLWYPGPEDAARKAYSSILNAGPVFELSEMTPYDKINAGADHFGQKGGYKPGVAASFMKLNPPAVAELWHLYLEFLEKYPQAAHTTIMLEFYSLKRIEEIPDDETAFPHRHLPCHGLAIPIYMDPSITEAAAAFGSQCRSILRRESGLSGNPVYINFASGDETQEELYGDAARLERLTALKRKWDPRGCFNQFNPIIS